MTIECYQTLKSYRFGVNDILRDKWAFHKGMWRLLRPNYKDEVWYEDYQYSIAETKDILECWLSFLPGIEEWGDYYDFSATFNMNDVEEAGWCEQYLREMLRDMVYHIRMNPVIHAEEPWLTETTDAWGQPHRYYRHPAIEPLPGMLVVDYPSDLTPDG